MTDLPPIALSVRQPWAWAIIHGGKDIENRSAAAVRHGLCPGRIAVHAAKGMTRHEYEAARNMMVGIGVACPGPADLVRGAIIGAVTVTSIVGEHESPWFFGPRGLVLADAIACRVVAASGSLGYFEWVESGAPAKPLPWMVDWPGCHKRIVQPVTAPLFE